MRKPTTILAAAALALTLMAGTAGATAIPGIRLTLPDISGAGWNRITQSSFRFRHYNAPPAVAWQKGESCLFIITQQDPGFYIDDIVDLTRGTLAERAGVEVQATSAYPMRGWDGYYLRLTGPGESLGTCSNRHDIRVVNEYWITIYDGHILQAVLSSEASDYTAQHSLFGDFLNGIHLEVAYTGSTPGGQGPVTSSPPVTQVRPGEESRVVPVISTPGLANLVRAVREKQGLTREQLARLANVTEGDVANLEAGERVMIDVVDRIAATLAEIHLSAQ